MRTSWLLVLLVACGSHDPALRNVPQPSTKAVAGGAAAIAGAATLVDPNGQANRVQEANKPDDRTKPMKPGPSVPADVLDRLDDAPAPKEPPPPSETRKWPSKKAPVKAAPKTPVQPPQTNPLNPGN
jgi:hypothetical protein